MTKTDCFWHWVIGNWDLFVIWCLGFVIFDNTYGHGNDKSNMKNKIERMKKHKEVMNLVSLREAPPRRGDEAIFKGLGSMVKRLLR